MLSARLRADLGKDDGVSLVELLVVVLLMGVIGSVVVTSLVRGMNASLRTQDRFDGLADLQQSVDRVTGVLRGADPLFIPASTPAGSVAAADVWNATLTQRERFTYTYCPEQQRIHVRRTASPGPTVAPVPAVCGSTTDLVLIDRVTNGTATQVFTGTQTDTGWRSVRVNVQRAVDKGSASAPPITVTSLVELRNAR